MSILIHNAMIVTMDGEQRVYGNGGLLVQRDKIHAIGSSSHILSHFSAQATEIIDFHDHIILPGFINTHVHTSQQLARGIADDVDLMTWLHKRIWPYESQMTEDDSYISTLLCGVELIHSGVTCFAEAGGQHVAGMARAVECLGIRGCLAQSVMDTGEGLPVSWTKQTAKSSIQIQEELYKNLHNTADGRIKVWFGLRQIMNATDDLLLLTKEFADKLNTGIHMHVAEIPYENEYVASTRAVNQGTVTYLENIGLLGENLLAAHSVWINNAEVELLSKAGVKVSHCPAAAMRMLGFAPIKEMLDVGICVSLGTDGAPSNNRMSIVDEMYLASLINKGREVYNKGNTDPTALPAETILKMATIDGAKAVLWDKEIGSLEVGKKVFEQFKQSSKQDPRLRDDVHNFSPSRKPLKSGFRFGEDQRKFEDYLFIVTFKTVHLVNSRKLIELSESLQAGIKNSDLTSEDSENKSGIALPRQRHPWADLVVINPCSWTTIPLHDPISSLVYCMRTENVDSLMCNGQWIMRNRKILTVNEEEILSTSRKVAPEILSKANIEIPKRMNIL